MRNKLIGVGVGISFLAFLPFLLMFLDLLLFIPRSWPYASGASHEYFLLYSSLFWTKYIAHCHFVKPTFLSEVILRYWVIPFCVGLHCIVLAFPNKDALDSNPSHRFGFLAKASSYGRPFIVLSHLCVYFAFGSHIWIITSSLGLVLFMPILVLFPLFTFILTNRCLVKKTLQSVLILCFWLIIDFICYIFIFLFLLSGCI